MIRTQDQYESACNFIDSDIELYDFMLSERMSSYEYNLYLQDTEYFLNFLYEKIRTLEELCDFLEVSIENKIRNATEEIDKKLSMLENSLGLKNIQPDSLTKPKKANVRAIYIEGTEYFLDNGPLDVFEEPDQMYYAGILSDEPDELGIYDFLLTSAILTNEIDTIYQDMDGELDDEYDDFGKYLKSTSKLPNWNYNISQGIIDRDGSVMSIADCRFNMVMPLTKKYGEIIPQFVVKDAKNSAYQDNLATTLTDGYYLTSYQKTDCQQVTESINIIIPQDSEYNSIEIEPINCSISINKNDTGFEVIMDSFGYDKELRCFDFGTYKACCLNKFTEDKISYDPVRSISDNYDFVQEDKMPRIKKKYMEEIADWQKTYNINNSKSKVLGAIS